MFSKKKKNLRKNQEEKQREKVTANKDFIDKLEKRLVLKGEKIIVAKERAIELSEAGMIEEKYKQEKTKKSDEQTPEE